MTIHKASGPLWRGISNLIVQPKRGPLAPFGVPGGSAFLEDSDDQRGKWQRLGPDCPGPRR
jgi:hypothetical protein